MKKKPELKLGDEFWFYDSFGELNVFPFVGWNTEEPDRVIAPMPNIDVHWRAIQGVIRKVPKKRREWWIKKYLFTKFDPIRTTPPEDKTGWIKVRECKE